MFTAASFVIAKTGKQPRCPSVGKWISKLWYIQSMEYYQNIIRPLQLEVLHFSYILGSSQSLFQILGLNFPPKTINKFSIVTIKFPTKFFREFHKLIFGRENSQKYEGHFQAKRGKDRVGYLPYPISRLIIKVK